MQERMDPKSSPVADTFRRNVKKVRSGARFCPFGLWRVKPLTLEKSNLSRYNIKETKIMGPSDTG